MAFNQASGTVIIRSTFNDHGGRNRINGFEQLRASIAEGAFHNSLERFDPPKCHPETRIAMLDMILAWVNNRRRTSSIMWLHGPAGAGKSAIVQTITEECEKSKTLCASFFFSRTAARRNTANHLMATIAHQLIRAIPQLAKPVNEAVESDSALFALSLHVQFQQLIVDPIICLMEQDLWPQDSPQLVAIDGLDECENPDIQKLILTVISEALISSKIPLCFLVASRPELELREAFNTGVVQKLSTCLALDDSFDPDKDIETFILSKFAEIIQTHQLRQSFPPGWPSDDAVQTLVGRSSRQFIYASVVMKYLGNPRKSPVKGLNIILGLAPPGDDNPYGALDQLYHHILSNVDDYPATSRVLGAILYMDYEPCVFNEYWQKTLEILDYLLLSEKGNTALYLSDLHSVIYVPSQESSNIHVALKRYNSDDDYDSDDDSNSLNLSSHDIFAVRFLHASFGDFLMDASRSGQYHINKSMFYGDLALCCLRNVSHEINRYKQPSPTIVAQQYASESCFDYLSLAAITPHLLDELSTVDFLDVLKCGFLATLDETVYQTIETPASKVLKFLSFLTDNSQAGRVFTSLQNSMDLHHLDILSSRPSSNISEAIYAILGCIFMGDILESFGRCLRPRVDIERTTEFPIHLKGDVCEIYGEWLLEFLSTPSRSKQYTMRKIHYEGAIFAVLSWLWDPSYEPHDTDLQLLLSKISGIYQQVHNDDARRIISTNTLQISMHNDIWKRLIGNERGSRAGQSQSFKLPTVLIVDGRLTLKGIGLGVTDNRQQGVFHLEVADEDHAQTRSDQTAILAQQPLRRSLRKRKQLDEKPASSAKNSPTRKRSGK